MKKKAKMTTGQKILDKWNSTVYQTTDDACDDIVRRIDRAIAAERNRCVKAIRKYIPDHCDTSHKILREIAP